MARNKKIVIDNEDVVKEKDVDRLIKMYKREGERFIESDVHPDMVDAWKKDGHSLQKPAACQ